MKHALTARRVPASSGKGRDEGCFGSLSRAQGASCGF